MMKPFMDETFMLYNPTAVHLFETYAKDQPIFDYHCHLSAKEIYENQPFQDIAQMWLSEDHYKWRMMRANGIPEEFITGSASGYEKFKAYGESLMYAIGNPLYHWSHLELQRYFQITECLGPKTVDSIWEKANRIIDEGDFTPRALIHKSNVYALCTTEDPIDSLEYHFKIKQENLLQTKILPAFRPDRVLAIEAEDFAEYIQTLEKASGYRIDSYGQLKNALIKRMDDFAAAGCVASDHGFEYVPFRQAPLEEVEKIFESVVNSSPITNDQVDAYKTDLMVFLGKEYYKRNWAMEIHMGVMRNLSQRRLQSLGGNTGFDSIADKEEARNVAALLDAVDRAGECPKTILFSLNPADNWVLGSMAGNFMDSDVIGKIQLGTAWWFLDNRDGMEDQMRVLANSACLGRFVGMLTDSRSFLSYPRHEYFRRIVCNLIGSMVENGEYPEDEDALKEIIEGICFKNVQRYLGV